MNKKLTARAIGCASGQFLMIFLDPSAGLIGSLIWQGGPDPLSGGVQGIRRYLFRPVHVASGDSVDQLFLVCRLTPTILYERHRCHSLRIVSSSTVLPEQRYTLASSFSSNSRYSMAFPRAKAEARRL